ncbi:MAG: chromosomal replication initiator protein DnaA [Anaerolineales bacterium]|nr:chromosomal replication initiator protein DnaA [Anaerolineales bacterium]MCB0011379.1 chromosomal replication initiator protein DnaA [Anaerolineales bacterium]MCB0016302.1 chromosomal replication initiator protein DnaA [Anaerolineales bacterium]MCB0030962.1 chromosomal replication initiator protein DnaA [Anaerolineales bacterium]MCB8962881.1 chromosomal replication initiator protein DnaA [Ardenticatenales bacterium]
MTPESAWKAALGELEMQMTRATFNTWLKDAHLLRVEDESYVIGVRNDYARDWLSNRLNDTIHRTLSTVVGNPVKIDYVVSNGVPAPANGSQKQSERHTPPVNGQHNGHVAPAGPAAESLTAGLKPHYIFENYVVGHGNRLAHAAALSVSEQPGHTYNPLFIYGGVGLGKTHLLHAIGHRCLENGFTVCYVTSETFTNDLIQAIRTQETAAFREKYRTPDVLLIDDVQFVAGKESTQEELFHTFNDLHSLGRQVVLSSDRPPKAMTTLEERLKSRFEWGLMTDIQMPDIETRHAILRAKAEQVDVHIPDEVMDLIAQRVRNNIRELEGALTKVVAYAELTGAPIDMALVRSALSDLIKVREKVTIEDVLDKVCDHFAISEEALNGKGRSKGVAYPRQVGMYLCRTETNASLPQIGTALGGRDHTTVMYGHDKIEGLLDTDQEVRQDVMAIKSLLYDQNHHTD